VNADRKANQNQIEVDGTRKRTRWRFLMGAETKISPKRNSMSEEMLLRLSLMAATRQAKAPALYGLISRTGAIEYRRLTALKTLSPLVRAYNPKTKRKGSESDWSYEYGQQMHVYAAVSAIQAEPYLTHPGLCCGDSGPNSSWTRDQSVSPHCCTTRLRTRKRLFAAWY